MAAAPSFMVGWLELLIVLLGGSGLLGMPPGERDASLLKAVPQQTLFYFEWAGRGAGQPGGVGIEGLAADPEIVAFFEALDQAIAKAEFSDLEEEQARLRREIPKLVKLLISHPGCLFIGFDPPAPGESLLAAVRPNELVGRFRIGLISSAGKDAEALLESFSTVAQVELAKPIQLQEVSAGPMAVKLTVHQEANHVMIGFGPNTLVQSLACLKGKAASLETNPRFQAGSKRVVIDRFATINWLDVRGVFDTATRTAGPAGLLIQAVVRGASADAVDYVVTGSGLENGDLIQRTFIATDGRTDGVLTLASGSSLRGEQLRHIPADSDLVLAGSMNLAQVVRNMRDLVGKTTPGSAAVFDEAVKQMESELGLSLERDVYPAIGDAWTAFNSPSEGGMFGSSLIVAVEVRDLNRAGVLFERLMKLLEQSVVTDSDFAFGVKSVELKRQSFLNHTIFQINTIGWGLGSEALTAPSFCLSKSHILFALHPQALKAHLRRQAGNEAGFDTVLSRNLPRPDGDLLAIGSMNGLKATQALCAIGPFFGQSVLSHFQSEGFPLDAFAIPSAAALLPYARDTTFVAVRQNDGLILEVKNAHVAIATALVFGSVKAWFMPSYQDHLELEGRRGGQGDKAVLGQPEGQVVPAAAAQAAADKPQEKPAAAVARKVVPLVIKAAIPDGVQQFIPENVFRRIEQPPTEEELKQREERRKQIEARRQQRKQKRAAPIPE